MSTLLAPSWSLQSTTELAKVFVRIYARPSLTLARLSSRVRASADLARIDNLRREVAPALAVEPTGAAKYANYRYWIPFNVARIGALALHKEPPLRILDIGCGPGYFLAAARACGHDCCGVDAPPGILTKVERRVYSELLAAMHCSAFVSSLFIERFVPMRNAPADLDLITAFWVCFNRHRQADEWGVSEWQFFVEDALLHLQKGGLLHLEINENPKRYASLRWYDRATLDYFVSIGTVDGGVVRIRKVKGQP